MGCDRRPPPALPEDAAEVLHISRAQVLWIAYALVTDQPGFIVSALAYGFVYARNWKRWKESGR